MKRITALLFLFCIAATPPPTNPRSPAFVPLVTRAAVVAGCSTSRDAKSGVTTSGYSTDSDTPRLSSSFVAGASYTACKAVLRLSKTGSPSGTLKVGIFTDSGGLPNVQVGSYSDTVNCSTLAGSEGDITFINLSASIVSATTYHVVLFASAAHDGSNFVTWHIMDSTGDLIDFYSTSGGVWDYITSDAAFKWTLYSN